MAKEDDVEDCFKKHFDNEPGLQIHYFMIKSFYNGDRNLVLDDEVIARQFQISRSDVRRVADDINQCSFGAVSYRQNLTYTKTIITDFGRKVLQHDIIKTVPLEGIGFSNFKTIFPFNLLSVYLQNGWLDKIGIGNKVKIVRGKKFKDFVCLHNSLCLYNKTKCLTNKKDMFDAKLIEKIDGRLEITRGLNFPSDKYKKMVLLYKLADKMFNQIVRIVEAAFYELLREEGRIVHLQNQLIKQRSIIDKQVDDYNVYACRMLWQRETFVLMHKQIRQYRRVGFSQSLSTTSRAPKLPPGTILGKELQLPQPKEQLFPLIQLLYQLQLQKYMLTFPLTFQQLQQHFKKPLLVQLQHQLQLMQQQQQQRDEQLKKLIEQQNQTKQQMHQQHHDQENLAQHAHDSCQLPQPEAQSSNDPSVHSTSHPSSSLLLDDIINDES